MTFSGWGDLTVRPFRAEDAESLTEMLHRAYADLAASGLNYTAATQDVATTTQRARGGRCWVVAAGDRPVATVTMSIPPGHGIRALTAVARVPQRAWLNQLAVDPDYRGRGLARALWAHGVHWARSQSIAAIGADTALTAEHLVSMYGRWGFSHVDTVRWPGKTYDSAVLLHQWV